MRFMKFIKAVSLALTTSIVLGMAGTARYVAAAGVTLSGSCNVQRYGDIEGTWDDSSSTLTLKGHTNENEEYRQFEGITVNLNNSTGYSGTLKYSVYVQSKGWQEFVEAGSEAGLRNKGLRIDALKMELTGELASQYTIEYAVKVQKNGYFQGYVADGSIAGSESEARKIEEIQIKIVRANTGSSTSVNYRTHVESTGWGTKWVKDGALSGAAGKGKKIDSLELNLTGNEVKGGITYRSFIQGSGWEPVWSSNGETSGTQGMRTEAVQIKLTDEAANKYDVYYRVYLQVYGWLGWAKNGETSGATELSSRLEAIQIKLVTKGGSNPGNEGGVKSDVYIPVITPTTPILPGKGIFKMPDGAKVSYAVKTADGWSEIVSDGEVLNVSGNITGIAVGVNISNSELQLVADTPYFGYEKTDSKDPYDTYGTPCDLRIIDTGKAIEYVRMALYYGHHYYYEDGTEFFYCYEDNPAYSIFYRVKTSKYEWMAWTKDGLRCGTDEIGNTITAIQIVVLPYGQTPAADLGNVTSDNEKSVLVMEDFPAPKLVTSGNKFASWCLKQFPNNQKTLEYLSQHKRRPTYVFYSVASTWPYKLGGKTKKKCDCTGFAVWVFKNYHKKKVAHNSHKMAFKTGKTVSYKSIKPGDLLCDTSTYHGDVFFYIGKDEYGHDMILDGMTPKINGKIKYVYPCIRYMDVEDWASKKNHYIRHK